MDVGYLIKIINDKLKVKADAELKKHNLTLTQSRVLSYLNRCGGRATQKEIELFLNVSHPTVVGIVSRMEHNGYLISRPSEDNRNKNVKLTDKALAISVDITNSMLKTEQILLEALSIEQREQLKEMLVVIANHLD